MTDNTPTPASQKLTEQEFKELAHEELKRTGVCSEREINALIALTLQLERGGIHHNIQER